MIQCLQTEQAGHNVYSSCYEKKLNTSGRAPVNRSNLDTHAVYDRRTKWVQRVQCLLI